MGCKTLEQIFLLEDFHGKGPLGTVNHSLKDDMKMDHKLRRTDVEEIDETRNRNQRRSRGVGGKAMKH